MRPYYEHAGITIYHGDCREVLPSLSARCADLVLTDPPYSDVTHAGARGGAGDDVLVDFASVSDDEIRAYFAAMAPIVDRWLVSFLDWRHMHQFEREPLHGLRFVRHGIWVKPNGAPQFTGDRPATGWEAIAFLHRDGIPLGWNGGGRHSVFTYNKLNTNEHPTQKPESLVIEIIRLFTAPHEVVVDPFMGSGTTLAAAKRTNRIAIGMEIEERYCEIAAKRLQQEALPLDVA